MNIRVTQLDGKLPNLALMRLAAWHRYTRMMERKVRGEMDHEIINPALKAWMEARSV